MGYKEKMKESHFYNIIHDFEYLLNLEYDTLESIIFSHDKLINKHQIVLEKKIDEWKIERKRYDNAPGLFDMFETEILNINMVRNQLFKFLFVAAYSIFENHFKKLAYYLKDEKEIEKSIYNDNNNKDKNKKLSYIDKYKKIIDDDLGVSLENIEDLWKEIENYRNIRNAIVHDNGILDNRKKEKIKHFVNSNEFVYFRENYIEINSIKFIFIFNKLIKNIYSKVIEEVVNQIIFY